MRLPRLAATALMLGLALAACKTTGEAKPATLPEAAAVQPPGPGVSAEHARFAGIWQGTWGESLDGKLAVTRVGPDGSVDAIYAWGDNPGRFRGGHNFVKGKIEGETLTLERFGSGADVSYEMQPDGWLKGHYHRPGHGNRAEAEATGRFDRISGPEA
ncbi:MAG: hypothetical protein TEF_12575 [Rhizobiales bacterium NRL2]|jgi:hypothetical protein|nr:MAG: hypothetical protein TEF_12575 [Rhizobiales bacterium NRL2]